MDGTSKKNDHTHLNQSLDCEDEGAKEDPQLDNPEEFVRYMDALRKSVPQSPPLNYSLNERYYGL